MCIDERTREREICSPTARICCSCTRVHSGTKRLLFQFILPSNAKVIPHTFMIGEHAKYHVNLEFSDDSQSS